MARTAARNRTRQTKDRMLGIAVTLLGMGVLLAVADGLFRSDQTLAGAATEPSLPAVLAFGLGASLLVVRHLFKRNPPGAQARLKPGIADGGRNAPGAPTSPASEKPRPVQRERTDALTPIDLRRAAKSPLRSLSPKGQWSAAVFSAIEWRRFEAVCETLFAQAGFDTRAQPHGGHGGVAIWLHSKNAEGPVAMVQCKHSQGKPVGVKELRDFFDAMASRGVKRGTYATASTYTADAWAFAQSHGIHALDGTGLLALIAQRTPEQQAALLEVAYEAEYWKPTCASCGIKLVEGNPAKRGMPFWRCSNHPRCTTRVYMSPKG